MPESIFENFNSIWEGAVNKGTSFEGCRLKRKHDLFWAALNGGGGLLTVERTGRVFDIDCLFQFR